MGKIEIAILLDSEPKNQRQDGESFFEPGQTISGHVVCSLYVQKIINAITIAFEGWCYTHSDSEENIPLFGFSETLFQGPFTMQPTTLSLPFSFTLPEGSSFHRNCYNRQAKLFNQGPQPLPPSLDIDRNGHQANITYNLTATINPLRIFNTKKTVLPLQVASISEQPLYLPCPKSIPIAKQLYKSNSLRLQQHSFRQKISHIFTCDPSLRTPTIAFRATAYMPSSGSVWQYLPLSISIHQVTGPTDPANPTLILKNVTVTLKQYTSMLVERLLVESKSNFASMKILLMKELGLDNTPLEISSSILATSNGNSSVRLVDICRGAKLPTHSFATYTIHHSYKLKLRISILHPETGHRFRLKAKTEFQIFPPYMDDSGPDAVNGGSTGPMAELQMNRVDPAPDTSLTAATHGGSSGSEHEIPAYDDASVVPAYGESSSSGQYPGEESGSKVENGKD